MNIKINIEEDNELRASIKNAVEGQVKSLNRDEIVKSLQEEIVKKLNNKEYMDTMVRNTIISSIGSILMKQGIIQQWQSDWIQPYVENAIRKSIDNLNLDFMVKQKLDRILDSEILKAVKKTIKE